MQGTVGVPVDGVFGLRTTAALRQWQVFNGLSGSGRVTRATWRSLLSNHVGTEPRPFTPRATVSTPRGGQSLVPGRNGIKVGIVQARLGLGERWETMDATTIAAVRAFQRRRGLVPDGIVGPLTWNALGTGLAWSTVDTWRPRPVLPATGVSASQRREAMIDFALDQRGSEYVWGGAGPARFGYDCSGLVIQALAAAGVDFLPVTVVNHSYGAARTSQFMYNTIRMQKVPLAQRARGDIVFWQDTGGTVRHMAIYLGSGRVVQSVEPSARVSAYSSRNGTNTASPWVLRPFG